MQTEVGTASVAGTVFTVQVEEKEMKMKQMTVRVLAGAVLVAAAAGGQERLHAQEAHVEARVDFDGIQGTRGRGQLKGPETPAQKELRALRLQQAFLQDRQEALQNEALQEAEVAKAMEASQQATIAFYEKLEAHPDYQALQKQQEELNQQRKKLYVKMRGKDRQARQEVRAEVHEMHNDIRTVSSKINRFPETDPELAKLKKAKQEAALAFLAKLEAKLNEDEEYVVLDKRLETLQETLQLVQRDSWRERREEMKKKAQEQGQEETPAKPKPVETF